MIKFYNIRVDYIKKSSPDISDPGIISIVKIIFAALRDRGFRAVFLYRIGRYFRIRNKRVLAILFERLIHRLCFSEISTTADIGPGFRIYHPFGMVVGTDVKAGKDLTLSMDALLGGNINKSRPNGTQKPILGDNVNIAAGGKVVGPVEIGDNCLIGANSVVIRSIPSNCIVAGVPAQIIKREGIKVSIEEHQGEIYDLVRNLINRIAKLENSHQSGNHT